MSHRLRGPGLAVLLAASPVGCTEADRSSLDVGAVDEATVNPVLDGVTWGVDWDLGSAEYTEEGWAVTNDLGFTFALEAGWLVDYSLTLVPCADAVADAGWERLLGIGLAHAHHVEFDDPSEVIPQHPEALEAPGYTPLGALAFDPATYCSVHWLVASADEGVRAPDGTDLADVALSVAARWEGAETSGVLDLATEWTNGVLLDLRVDPADLAGDEPVHGTVTVVRSLDGLFDGIDPVANTDLEIAWAMLTNLVEQAEVRFHADAKR